MKWIPLTLIATGSLLSLDYHSFMKDPTYSGKTLSTSSGGFISAAGIRIQGKQIEITKSPDGTCIHASKLVAFLYKGNLLLADTLTYNITKKQGIATNIRANYNIYSVQAKTGTFKEDGTIIFTKATLSPEDGLKPLFSIFAREVILQPDDSLEAHGVLAQTGKIPVLYLPQYTYSLKKQNTSPFTYGLRWITGQGPEFSLEYTLYATEDSSVSIRGDIRPSRGLGVALQTAKKTKNGNYKTRSYLAHDTFYRSDDTSAKITRFRLQGELFSEREDKVAKARVKYDIFNDRTMPEDFPSSYFEYDAVELNKIDISYKLPFGMLTMRSLPKLNSFQGYAQEVPTLSFAMKPALNGPVLFTNNESLPYYRYTPAKDLASDVADYESIRFSSSSKMTAALPIQALRVVPYLGYELRTYSDSGKNVLLAATYGGLVELPLRVHTYRITPYLLFDGISTPTAGVSTHPIFTLSDGIDTLRELHSGIRQTIGFQGTTILFDAQAISFINQKEIGTKGVQKGKIQTQFSSTQTRMNSKLLWNFEEDVLDMFSLEFVSSISPRLAVSLLYMYRGDYYYRKDDRNQFILDANKSAEALFASPLSDRRNLGIVKMQYNLSDTLRFQGRLHTGFGRRDQASYTEGFASITQRITTHMDGSFHIGRTTRGMVGYGSLKMVY